MSSTDLRPKSGRLGAICAILFLFAWLPGCSIAAPTPEPMTIRFAYPWGRASREDYEALVEAFAESYPHITVELVTQSWRRLAN